MENVLTTFLAIVKQLRDPVSGCPWDKKQTHRSLQEYVIEEAYEVAEALEGTDQLLLAEELGDLLLQIALHAQIASETGSFTFTDIVEHITGKMIRRHPHVFGSTEVSGVSDVWKNWEHIKLQEKKNPAASRMDGIPAHLPALLKAQKIQKKAARSGFDWKTPADVIPKIKEEIEEFTISMQHHNRAEIEEEAGDLLFAVVNLLRKCDIDSEGTLQRANTKFSRRFRIMEKLIGEDNKKFEDLSLEQLEACWVKAKKING